MCNIGKFPIKRSFWRINSACLLFVSLKEERETCSWYSRLDRRVVIGKPHATQGPPSFASASGGQGSQARPGAQSLCRNEEACFQAECRKPCE